MTREEREREDRTGQGRGGSSPTGERNHNLARGNGKQWTLQPVHSEKDSN